MTTARPYRHEEDYERVGAFLVRRASADAAHHNWLPASWVPLRFHSILDRDHLGRLDVRKLMEPASSGEPSTSSPMEEP